MDIAVELIKRGELVAFPTETVYGLGADALNEKAIEKIFKVKGRPFEDPLIVHIADLDQLDLITEPLSDVKREMVEKLTKRFWPGPLTIIFKKKGLLSKFVTGGLDTVAVRMPRHLIALALIKNCKTPIAAPSANRFQSLSPTTALAVEKELGKLVSLILDGGPCEVGVESTVLSLEGEPSVLRPGGISIEDIESVLDCRVKLSKKISGTLASPGMMDFHYAPQKPLRLFEMAELEKELKKKTVQRKVKEVALLCFSGSQQRKLNKAGFKKIYVLSSRGSLPEAAQALFEKLRAIDESDAGSIFVLRCPDERLGVALNDRLKKAEHK